LGRPGLPPAGAARAWTSWRVALLAGAAAMGALYVAYALLYFDFPLVDRGWTIDHLVHNAWQIVQGQPLYVDPRLGSPTAFMYTPGLTYMLAPLVALFGPELWTARLLNLVAAALLIAIVTRETARRVRDRRLAWFAPALVFLTGATHEHQLLVAHPDNWSLVFAFLALIAARGAAETGRGLSWAVLALCAAAATKQTTLIFALAAAAPLAVSSRPSRAALLLAAVAGLLAAGAALAQAATHGLFLESVLLATRQQWGWDRTPLTLLYLAYRLGPYLLVLAAAPVIGRRRPRLRAVLSDPFLTAFVLALPSTIVRMTKIGATACNLLPLVLLLVPLFLQAVDALLPWFARSRRRAALAALLCPLWVAWSLSQDLPPLWRRIAAHG